MSMRNSSLAKIGNRFDVWDDQSNITQILINGDLQNLSLPFVGNRKYKIGDQIYKTDPFGKNKGRLTNARGSVKNRVGIVISIYDVSMPTQVLEIQFEDASFAQKIIDADNAKFKAAWDRLSKPPEVPDPGQTNLAKIIHTLKQFLCIKG